MTPEAKVPRLAVTDPLGFPDEDAWARAEALSPLVRSGDGGAPDQATWVRLGRTPAALLVRFDCSDSRPWCRHVRKDAPLWEDEVVEIFIAAGGGVPDRYVEIEVNPAGTVFDAIVDNPDGRRESMRVDTAWNASGLRVRVGRFADLWTAEIVLPWAALGGGPAGLTEARANFFRIDRPGGGPAECSAWSPTFVDPPDFHKPACFGRLRDGIADGG